MDQAFKVFLKRIVVVYLMFQLFGCGIFIYPERQGQPRGDIDPVVAILDGVGLLFFVVPGLVAFIIDFHTGTIYLPQGKTTKDRLNELSEGHVLILNEGRQVAVRLNPDDLTPDMIDRVIQTTTGHRFRTNDPELEVHRLDGCSHFDKQFKQIASSKGSSTLLFN